jgi:hypothetical protein
MNVGHIIKAAWVILALSCVSYVGFGFGAAKRAEAATLADILILQKLPYAQWHWRIRDERTMYLWIAEAGQVAHCFKIYAPVSRQVLNQQGYSFEQTMVTEYLAANIAEDKCYAQ